jgi:Tol biopolymer transport system component
MPRGHRPRELATMLVLAMTAIACSDSTPSAPPPPVADARIVVFASDSDAGVGTSLYLMHADGSSKVRLTSAGHFDMFPAWSPDGSVISFVTDRVPAGIWIVSADGSGLHPFLTAPDFDTPYGLVWSPDGSRIAFNARDDGYPTVFVADANGSHAHRLTADRGEQWPDWSPDGRSIAYVAARDTTGLNIFVSDTSGANERQLTTFGNDAQPRWSPDGTKIAFERIRGDRDVPLIVMNADGSNPRELTHGDENSWPAWSPDGEQLEYVSSNATTLNEIFRINVDGSEERAITAKPTSSNWPVWKPTP